MSRNGTHCCVCIPTFSDIFHDDNAKYNAEKKVFTTNRVILMTKHYCNFQKQTQLPNLIIENN